MDYEAFQKSSEWVYRLGFPKGDSYSIWGLIPLRQTCIGAQVAPQRCPILRCSKSSSIIPQALLLRKDCVIESSAGG